MSIFNWWGKRPKAKLIQEAVPPKEEIPMPEDDRGRILVKDFLTAKPKAKKLLHDGLRRLCEKHQRRFDTFTLHQLCSEFSELDFDKILWVGKATCKQLVDRLAKIGMTMKQDVKDKELPSLSNELKAHALVLADFLEENGELSAANKLRGLNG